MAIVGCGALGNIIADNLVRAGTGKLLLLDFDKVDLSNLHRQTLFTEEEIGESKVIAAQRRLEKVNSEVQIEIANTRLTRENQEQWLNNYQILIDATDSFQTSLELNAFAVQKQKPMVFGGIAGEEGNIMVYQPGGPCLACVAPQDVSDIPTAQTHGIIPTVPIAAGSIMATEALKCAVRSPFVLRKWWKFHLWETSSTFYSLEKNKRCLVCSEY